MPVWRSAESSPGASASALDGPELALRRLFGGRRDIHHGYLHRGVRGARVDIRQQRHIRRCLFAPVPYAGNLQNSRSARDRQVRSAKAFFPRTDGGTISTSGPSWPHEPSSSGRRDSRTLLIFWRAGVFLQIFPDPPSNRRDQGRDQAADPPGGLPPHRGAGLSCSIF